MWALPGLGIEPVSSALQGRFLATKPQEKPKHFIFDTTLISNIVAKFSHSVVSDSLRAHGLQHTRPPCPSPAPRVTQTHVHWVGDAIQTSHPLSFSSRLHSFPASGSFQMSQFFTSGGQSIGISASASVLPMNIEDWFPLGWTGWISLQSKGLSQESSPTPQFKSINSSALSFLYSPTLTSIHDHWKNHSLD